MEMWEVFIFPAPWAWGGWRTFSDYVIRIVGWREIRCMVKARVRWVRLVWNSAPRWKRGRFKAIG